MIQLIIVIGLFLLAAFWMGKRLYNAFWGSDGKCESCAVGKTLNQSHKSRLTTSSDD